VVAFAAVTLFRSHFGVDKLATVAVALNVVAVMVSLLMPKQPGVMPEAGLLALGATAAIWSAFTLVALILPQPPFWLAVAAMTAGMIGGYFATFVLVLACVVPPDCV
jgi:hypothetical protein